MKKCKGIIGILTGGGDVPGLNPVIRATTLRAISEGYRVFGIKSGWHGLVDINHGQPADQQENIVELSANNTARKITM